MTLLSSQLLCLAVLILGALVAGLILLLRDLDVPPVFDPVFDPVSGDLCSETDDPEVFP